MSKKRILWIVTVCLVFVLLATAGLPAFANLDEYLNQKRELTENLEAERDKLEQQLNQAERLQEEIRQLDRKLQQLREEIAYLEGEIEKKEEEIAVAEQELAAAEEALARQEGLFKRRLRAMYTHQGAVTYLEVLLKSRTFADFLTRLNNLKTIAVNDLKLLEEIEAERDRIQEMKEDLERQKESLDQMRRQTVAHKGEVERTVAAREQKEAELQVEIERRRQVVAEMEKESERLDSIIRSLIGTDWVGGIDGPLHWPIEPPYYISSGFGPRSFDGWHPGLDIAPYNGAHNYILAAEDGRVILSGWNAYGNCIMIDHGGGVVTLYGHLHVRSVSEGDWVSRGQRIGKAGTTYGPGGYSTGVHLHFEVYDYGRKPTRYYSNGNPDYRQNPMEYF